MPPRPMPPPPPPPDFAALKSYLNLTDSQVRQLQAATDKAAKVADAKAKILRPQIEEKRRALSDLLEKENSDATQVGRAVLEIRGLERQMRQAREAVRIGTEKGLHHGILPHSGYGILSHICYVSES